MNNEPVYIMSEDIKKVFSRWENQIKDIKARRDIACRQRDSAIFEISILSTEIGSATEALNRAMMEDRNKKAL